MSISYFDKKQPNFKKLLNYGFKKEKEKYLFKKRNMILHLKNVIS